MINENLTLMKKDELLILVKNLIKLSPITFRVHEKILSIV